MTSELVEYSGYLTFRPLAAEQLQAIQQLTEEAGIEISLAPDWLELVYAGRDTGRRLVGLLQRLAALIGDADGEVVCQIDQEQPDPLFEFYSIRNGQLLRQKGSIVREPAIELVREEAHRIA